MYDGIYTEYDLEKYLNNFLPKLFYEIECDKRKVTVRVPELVKEKVLCRLEMRLPFTLKIIVVGI